MAGARMAGAADGTRVGGPGSEVVMQAGGLDADVPRLHAGAAVELTDPVAARLAEEAVSILDPRHGVIRDHTLEPLARIDAALEKIEAELAAAVRRAGGSADQRSFPSVAQGTGGELDLAHRAREAAGMEARLRGDLGWGDAAGAEEVERLLTDLGETH